MVSLQLNNDKSMTNVGLGSADNRAVFDVPLFAAVTPLGLKPVRFLRGVGVNAGVVLALVLSHVSAGKSPPTAEEGRRLNITPVYFEVPKRLRANPVASLILKKDTHPPSLTETTPAVAPRAAFDAPTPLLGANVESLPPILARGLPMPQLPSSAPSILPVKVGLLDAKASALNAPARPALIPSLAPILRPATASGATGTRTSGDSLRPAAPVAQNIGPASAGLRDLSASSRGLFVPPQPPPGETAFAKPAISSMPKPDYPLSALQNKTEGDVMMEVTFDKNGRVVFKRFVHRLSNEELNSLAQETLKQIKFIPAKRDGISVDHDATITVAFRLAQLTISASL